MDSSGNRRSCGNPEKFNQSGFFVVWMLGRDDQTRTLIHVKNNLSIPGNFEFSVVSGTFGSSGFHSVVRAFGHSAVDDQSSGSKFPGHIRLSSEFRPDDFARSSVTGVRQPDIQAGVGAEGLHRSNPGDG